MADWYVQFPEKIVGPIPDSELKLFASMGEINQETPVHRGDGKWTKAGNVRGLFSQLKTYSPTRVSTEVKKVTAIIEPPPAINQPMVTVRETAMIPSREVIEARQTKACPFCSEEIKIDAVKCRFCNEYLDAALRDAARPKHDHRPQQQQPQTVVNNIMHNTSAAIPTIKWDRGVAALASLLIPGLGQIYKGQVFNGLCWFIVTAVGYVAFVIPGIFLHICCVIGAASGDNRR